MNDQPLTVAVQATYLCPKCSWPMNLVQTAQPRQIACSNPLCKEKGVAYWEPRFELRKA